MEDQYSELYEKFSHLQWLLHRHHLMCHAAHGPFADTTRGQGRVLAMLKIQPEISTKDLSYLLGIKVASLNELLNKLEKSGYIVRKPSEADKRVMIIHLTEKGKAEQQTNPDYSGIFDCLSPEERETFSGYLDRVIAALESQVETEADEDEMANWARAARERLGDDLCDQIMAMRRARHDHDIRGFGFFGKCGPGGRGPGPREELCVEPLDPNGRGRPDFDRRDGRPDGRRTPPPPPHETDDE